MKLNDVIGASEDVVAREVSGETIMLDLESGLYFGLNSVGGRVWQCIESDACSIAKICDAIEEDFDAPRAEIERDVLALCDDLAERNLISIVPDSAT